MNIVVFDVETTGLDTARDQIVELYMNKLNEHCETIAEFHEFIKPTCPMNPDAQAVHGITMEQLEGKPTFNELAPQIVDFIDGCYLCGHNITGFDIIMLANQLGNAGIDVHKYISRDRLLDTCNVERVLMPHTLIATFKRYAGHDYADTIGAAHGAKADTLATVEVLKYQLDKLGINSDEMTNDTAEQFRQAGNPNDSVIDLAGYLYRNEAGQVCYNFGKNKGLPVKSDTGYARWMLCNSFPKETLQMLSKALNE